MVIGEHDILTAARRRREACDAFNDYQPVLNDAVRAGERSAEEMAQAESDRLFGLWQQARLKLYGFRPNSVLEAAVLLEAFRQEEEDAFCDDPAAQVFDNVVAALRRLSKP